MIMMQVQKNTSRGLKNFESLRYFPQSIIMFLVFLYLGLLKSKTSLTNFSRLPLLIGNFEREVEILTWSRRCECRCGRLGDKALKKQIEFWKPEFERPLPTFACPCSLSFGDENSREVKYSIGKGKTEVRFWFTSRWRGPFCTSHTVRS